MENYRNDPFGTTPLGGSARAAGDIGGAGGQNAGQQGVTDKAREVAHEARQKAGEQVRTGLDFGKSRAAEALHGVANSLHQSCQTNQDGATRYIQQAGDRVMRAADYLERTDVREMVRHTEDFARRQPLLFLGGALALGVTAARFFRSSQRDNQPRELGYEGTWQGGVQSSPSYDRERPLGGYQTGASYADAPSSIDPTAPLGAGGIGSSGIGSSGLGSSGLGSSGIGSSGVAGGGVAGGGLSGGGLAGSGMSGAGMSGGMTGGGLAGGGLAGSDIDADLGTTSGAIDAGETPPPPAGRAPRNRR
jgi:hypothetical protein